MPRKQGNRSSSPGKGNLSPPWCRPRSSDSRNRRSPPSPSQAPAWLDWQEDGKARTSWLSSSAGIGEAGAVAISESAELVAFLFDTDAISEVLRKRPAPAYIEWLEAVPQEDQFTSAVSMGELFRGAFRSVTPAHHLKNIESRILPALTVLPYDLPVARLYGEIQAYLAGAGRPLADADLQIAATALHHDLEVVTGNIRHFERIPGLRIRRALAEARPAPL